jgi:hypothetical protein
MAEPSAMGFFRWSADLFFDTFHEVLQCEATPAETRALRIAIAQDAKVKRRFQGSGFHCAIAERRSR